MQGFSSQIRTTTKFIVAQIQFAPEAGIFHVLYRSDIGVNFEVGRTFKRLQYRDTNFRCQEGLYMQYLN